MNASEVTPDTPDGSVESIECVDFLEKIPYPDIPATMVALAKKLAPGGKFTATVPDFELNSRLYLAGEPVDIQSLVMGRNGGHQSIFDREALKESMAGVGLVRMSGEDAPEGYFSISGRKPSAEVMPTNCVAILSGPRYMPLMHAHCANRAFYQLMPYEIHRGAYWHQVLSDGMEKIIARTKPDFIYTCDFDTAFSRSDVIELYRLMIAFPEADCIAPIQANRGKDAALFSIANADGTPKTRVYINDFAKNLTRISTAHFGLTIFRVSSLKKLPRPWMTGLPAGDGQWNDGDPANGIHGKTDPDIQFWQNWNKAGLNLHLANHVQIGHLEDAVKWVGRDLKTFYQELNDYNRDGIPAEAMR